MRIDKMKLIKYQNSIINIDNVACILIDDKSIVFLNNQNNEHPNTVEYSHQNEIELRTIDKWYFDDNKQRDEILETINRKLNVLDIEF